MARESPSILHHAHFQIIKRARQNYLFDQWKASNPSKEAIIKLAKNGIARFQKKHDEEEDQDKKKMYFDHLTKANAAVQGKFIEKKPLIPKNIIEILHTQTFSIHSRKPTVKISYNYMRYSRELIVPFLEERTVGTVFQYQYQLGTNQVRKQFQLQQ